MSIILRGIGEWVSERTGMPLKLATVLSLMVIAASLVALLWITWGRLSEEIGQLIERLPQALEQLRQRIAATKIGGVLLSQAPQINAAMSGRTDLLGSVTGVVSGTLGAIVSVMVIIFTGLYLALSPHLYIGGFLRFFPH